MRTEMETESLKTKDRVGSYGFIAEPFHCDFQHELFLGHLCNHLLNAADYHSDERGFGMNYLIPRHRTWVLSRFAIEIYDTPKAYDNICVDTWVDSVMRFFTSRNFAVRNDKDDVCAYGRSIWAMIDTESRHPVDIMAIHDGHISDYIETSKPCPISQPQRVRVGTNTQLLRTVEMQYSDVDVNGHVNSVKYIDHILNLWDLDWYRNNVIKRFDIVYVAESHSGDRLSFWREQTGDEEFGVSITKSSENGTNTIEVCRSSIKFVKR